MGPQNNTSLGAARFCYVNWMSGVVSAQLGCISLLTKPRGKLFTFVEKSFFQFSEVYRWPLDSTGDPWVTGASVTVGVGGDLWRQGTGCYYIYRRRWVRYRPPGVPYLESGAQDAIQPSR